MVKTMNTRMTEICDQVTEVFIAHTQSSFIGLAVHGSAVKGGSIPDWSDIDFQLYVEDSLMLEDGRLPLSLGMAIHQDLAGIDPAPYSYIQARVLSPSYSTYGGLVANTYQLLSGRLLFPDLTAEQLEAKARLYLDSLNPQRVFNLDCLLEHGDQRLQKEVRAFGTAIWPALFHFLTLQHRDGQTIWALTKDQAIAPLDEDTPIGAAIREFRSSVLRYSPYKASVVEALQIVKSGVAFLEFVKEWWDEEGRHGKTDMASTSRGIRHMST